MVLRPGTVFDGCSADGEDGMLAEAPSPLDPLVRKVNNLFHSHLLPNLWASYGRRETWYERLSTFGPGNSRYNFEGYWNLS